MKILVIGGGVNGCGIARDAAGRGLSVMLVEQGDLAQGTSSASTKLFHGGLRYLEFFEFGLVRHALEEREGRLVARVGDRILEPHFIGGTDTAPSGGAKRKHLRKVVPGDKIEVVGGTGAYPAGSVFTVMHFFAKQIQVEETAPGTTLYFFVNYDNARLVTEE